MITVYIDLNYLPRTFPSETYSKMEPPVMHHAYLYMDTSEVHLTLRRSNPSKNKFIHHAMQN